jgi:HTH-type transcriptional regulator/antitoxin HipB
MEYMITTPAQLGQVLEGCRKQQRLTQSDLGARVGLLQKAISAVETDPGRTNVARLFRLLSALDLELVLRDKRSAPPPHTPTRRRKAEW